MNPFAALVAFLGFQAQSGDRPGVEAWDPDRLAGLLAIAVAAVLDPAHGLVDLGDQLALPVAGSQLQRPIGFRRRAIGEVGVIFGLALQMFEGFTGLPENVLFPIDELLPEGIGMAIS